jgi:hypothetical protein
MEISTVAGPRGRAGGQAAHPAFFTLAVLYWVRALRKCAAPKDEQVLASPVGATGKRRKLK